MNDAFDNAQTDKEALARYGEGLTHAITVHQPYAWALAAGHKPVENRTWRPPLGMVGKLIGIHAGLTHRVTVLPHWDSAVMPPAYPQRTFGALIGVARLVGVVHREVHPGDRWEFLLERGRWRHAADRLPREQCERIRPWWRGPWGWLLEEAVLLPEPIPMRGQQGLWRITGCTGYDGSAPDLSGLTSNRYHNDWALEQWRKAREMVR